MSQMNYSSHDIEAAGRLEVFSHKNVMKKKTGARMIGGLAAAGAGALAAYLFAIRPWHLRWGATDEEIKETLPGDELVPHTTQSATHAVTINASARDVWPWLAQVGQTRGGFYSYTWLENLVGCRMKNAERVVPEWQDIKVGDEVWLHPGAPPLPVLICETGRALVLGSNTESPGTWGFYLKELGEPGTRLIIRGRGHWGAGLLNWLLLHAVFEPAHFIMERKMMLGIKQRAEAAVREKALSRPPEI